MSDCLMFSWTAAGFRYVEDNVKKVMEFGVNGKGNFPTTFAPQHTFGLEQKLQQALRRFSVHCISKRIVLLLFSNRSVINSGEVWQKKQMNKLRGTIRFGGDATRGIAGRNSDRRNKRREMSR